MDTSFPSFVALFVTLSVWLLLRASRSLSPVLILLPFFLLFCVEPQRGISVVGSQRGRFCIGE